MVPSRRIYVACIVLQSVCGTFGGYVQWYMLSIPYCGLCGETLSQQRNCCSSVMYIILYHKWNSVTLALAAAAVAVAVAVIQ